MTLPESDVIAMEHCRAWLEWAAVQVDRCVADDKPACNQLLRSLGEMLEPASAATSIDQCMAEVVVAVQSHDCVMQRLAHVSESLRMLHGHLGDARRAQSPDSWRQLRERQLRAFSMAEERALFSQMVALEAGGREIAVGPDESVELFVSANGLDQP
jgi:hypothetical protein